MTNPDYEMHLRPEEDYEMHFDDAGLKPEQMATVTPGYETQTVRPDPGCVFSEVTVEAIPEPTEEIDITENGVVDVARYGVANVAVPVGVFPSGTKLITQNVTGEDVTNYAAVDVAVPGPTGTKQISITANGTTTEDVSEYADVEITVNTLPEKGFVFDDYDSDGYPHSARFVGTWTEIPDHYCYYIFNKQKPLYSDYFNTIGYKVSSIEIPQGVTTIRNAAFLGNYALKDISLPESLGTCESHCFFRCGFTNITYRSSIIFSGQQHHRFCYDLETVVFGGDVNAIPTDCFGDCLKVILYDFSHCTSIPPISHVSNLGHAPGCVIRIPAALSDTTLGDGNGWESFTNYVALTDIVWEVV